MKKCSVLLLSCDKYIDVVKLNLAFLEKYWKDCPFDIYVSLERVGLEYDGSLNVKVLNSDSKEWSKRVKSHLAAIPTDYVMVTLDDFLVEEPVNNKIINNALALLEDNDNIANIAFAHFIGEKNENLRRDIFECRKKNRPSLLNWQIGLWNKEHLVELLRDEENPWESELQGSLRARYCCDYDFYCIDDDSNMPAVYGRGWLIVRGVWNGVEIERIEKKCGISFNPQNRPVEIITKIKTPLIQRVKNRIKIKKYEFTLKKESSIRG